MEKSYKIAGFIGPMEGSWRAVFALAHIQGPDGKTWDFRFEIYPLDYRNSGKLLDYMNALRANNLYASDPETGKFYRLGMAVSAEVPSIPAGAEVLPEIWSEYLVRS